jgi:hypothetical protein
MPFASELRIKKATRPLSLRWHEIPITPRRSTLLGISFRPLQAETVGLDVMETLNTLLEFPFQLIRLAAYWNRIEPGPGIFRPDELDRQVDAAERAGKQIIVSAGAIKNFGYPEYFVPNHRLPVPFGEGSLVEPAEHQHALAGATEFISRIVERYRDHPAVVAWQVEHEAVDPLGLEHSWRLSIDFVQQEVAAVRDADRSRPIVMNGFLPTSLPVRIQQWWRTRDQGDSLSVARSEADILGIDFYPRHALLGAGQTSVYLSGSRTPWHAAHRKRLLNGARADAQTVMIAEGQSEPWEAVTTPPNPKARAMYSCLPEHVIENYNQCMSWKEGEDFDLYAYLLWGAEYWLLRRKCGDPSYVDAFARLLDHA